MEEFRKRLKDSFENGIFQSKENKEKFLKGLEEIEKRHDYFFKDKPDGKKKIQNYIVPNNFTGKPLLGLSYESEMPASLKSDLLGLWNSIFQQDKK